MTLHRYRLNEPDVSIEDFKIEILAINLKNGHYHSLREAAVPILRLLMEGRDMEAITAQLAPFYGVFPTALTADLTSFVSKLEKIQLIVPAPDAVELAPDSSPEWLAHLSPVYTPPMLETYTDMQELLLLDPIHDVDDNVGWPHLPETKTDTP